MNLLPRATGIPRYLPQGYLTSACSDCTAARAVRLFALFGRRHRLARRQIRAELSACDRLAVQLMAGLERLN